MDLSELCTGCRTYRRFTQEPVPRPVVERMLETARTASSAANAQPVRATAVLDPQLVAQMQPLVGPGRRPAARATGLSPASGPAFVCCR